MVVNLYPFEQTVAKPDVTLHEAIENIDIGGPSMLRSAAKNHESVTVVVDPADYAEVARQITETGKTTLELRRKLAAKVFARTAEYDAAIAAHLAKAFAANRCGLALPPALSLQAPLGPDLALRRKSASGGGALRPFPGIFPATARQGTFLQQHSGPDRGGQLDCGIHGDGPTLAILKHTNPCGVGQGTNLREAWEKAYATDKQAPFGGIIAVNQPLDLPCAEAIVGNFQRGDRGARLRS